VQTEHSASSVRVAASDLLAFVALAISVALMVGVVLSASVLLLAAAAQAAPIEPDAAGCSGPKCKVTLYSRGRERPAVMAERI
jgi:predicted nucleic acid-binding Zn ribbon protein